MRKKKINKVDLGYTLLMVACFLPIALRGFLSISDFWFRIIFATFIVIAITVWIIESYWDKKHPNSFFNWSLKKTLCNKTLEERYAEMLESEEEDDEDISLPKR